MESAQRRRSAVARTWTAAIVVLVVFGAQVARANAPAGDAGAAVGTGADAGALAAPEPAAAPVVPVGPAGSAATPTLTPDLPIVAAPALDQPSPAGPVAQGKPFYRKDWFWGALGVVVLTVTIVLVATSGSSSDAPVTTLGNMRAF